jgi:hypothetical protein
MVLNPVQYAEDIFKQLNSDGVVLQATTNDIHNAITRVTGIYTDRSLRNAVKTFERLGFIKQTPIVGIWEINFGKSGLEKKIIEIEKEEQKVKEEVDNIDKYNELME